MDYDAPPIMNEMNCSQKSYLSEKDSPFYSSSINENKIHLKSWKNEENQDKNETEQYKTRIAIDVEHLKKLEHKNLIELIQFIQLTCDLNLNDSRYVDKTYSIFKMVKNQERQGYDITINNKKDNEEDKFKEDEKESDEDKINFYEEEEENDDDNNNNSCNINIKNKKENFYGFNEGNNNIIDYPKNDKKNNNDILIKEKDKQNENMIKDFHPGYIKLDQIPKFSINMNTNYQYSHNKNIPQLEHINNDSQSEYEEEEDEQEEKYNNKNNKQYIKCTDCDLFYDTVEEMTEHYYNIHEKNKMKEKSNLKENENNKIEEIDLKYEHKEDKMKETKENQNQKIFKINPYNQMNAIKIKNRNDLIQDKKAKRNIIDEEEEIERNFKADIDKIFENKGHKIKQKMKEITMEREKLIRKIKKQNKVKELDENQKLEIQKIIREMRKEAKIIINQETKEILKELKKEKNEKLKGLKLKKKENEGLKKHLREEKRKEYEKARQEETMKIKESKNLIQENKGKKEENKNQIKKNKMKEHFDESQFLLNQSNKLDYSLNYQRENNISDFYCSFCNRRFGTPFSFIGHTDSKGQHYQCKTCGKILLSKMSLEDHCKSKMHFH